MKIVVDGNRVPIHNHSISNGALPHRTRENEMTKSHNDRLLYAEEMASRYLANGNEASERGNEAKAEAWYAKCQFWLDRYNKLAGNS